MKKILLSLCVILLIAAAGFAYLALRSPKSAPPSDIKVAMTPERIERGRYLFEVAADCTGCHSERDWSKFSGPVLAGRVGVGVRFPPELGFPGDVYSANITPDKETGIGNWTDGEKIRAIREGISRDGRALFPFMPYQGYANMSDDDVQSVVAFMNTLAPVRNAMPQTRLNFPVNYLIKSAPQPVVGAVAAPDRSNVVRYGEYLVTIGGCQGCHTPEEKGERIAALTLAGGMEFRLGDKTVRSSNITPEVETGIGSWSEERFLAKFKGYANLTPESAPPAVQSNFTLMPWIALSQMPEEDIKAIYAYLRTAKAVKNAVDPHKVLVQP